MEVDSVKQLGKLQVVLAGNAQLAQHIKSFKFTWSMGGDCWQFENCCRIFEEEFEGEEPVFEGTTLELAFQDRLQLWDRIMKRPGAIIAVENPSAPPGGSLLYDQRGVFNAPGRGHDWDAVRDGGAAAYDWQSSQGGRGPDGNGEDRLIKNAEQFLECITALIGSLTSLEMFAWMTPVTPLPKAVYSIFRERQSLTGLWLTFSTFRSNLTDCESTSADAARRLLTVVTFTVPLWEIAGKLKSLKLDIGDLEHRMEEIEEELEADSPPPAEELAETIEELKESDPEYPGEEVHLFIARHLMIAAAKGGKLKHLDLNLDLYQPLAIRSLLPCWVSIEDYGDWADSWSEVSWKWIRAAVGLRPLLSHASLWLGARGIRRRNRNFTAADVQSLQSHFSIKGEPKMEGEEAEYFDALTHTIQQYLPWLHDPLLAHQVAVPVVDSGDADSVPCKCTACSA